MDAVTWLMDNVNGVGSRREATRIMNTLVEEQMVMHASGDANIPLLDGYFIYYIPSNKEGKTDSKNYQAFERTTGERANLILRPRQEGGNASLSLSLSLSHTHTHTHTHTHNTHAHTHAQRRASFVSVCKDP